MSTGVLFSGGKDSCLALYKFGAENVTCLLSILPYDKDSWMFHQPNEKLLRKQAEMLRLPLIVRKSSAEKNKELEDLRELIKESGVKRLVTGALASNYQGKRIKKICNDFGIKLEVPLWNYSEEKLWKELLQNDFKVILIKISCEGIGKEFIGEVIDKKKYEELKKLSEKYKFRLDFEGGEAETAVLWMPGFTEKINLDYEIKSEDKYRHFLIVKKIKK